MAKFNIDMPPPQPIQKFSKEVYFNFSLKLGRKYFFRVKFLKELASIMNSKKKN